MRWMLPTGMVCPDPSSRAVNVQEKVSSGTLPVFWNPILLVVVRVPRGIWPKSTACDNRVSEAREFTVRVRLKVAEVHSPGWHCRSFILPDRSGGGGRPRVGIPGDIDMGRATRVVQPTRNAEGAHRVKVRLAAGITLAPLVKEPTDSHVRNCSWTGLALKTVKVLLAVTPGFRGPKSTGGFDGSVSYTFLLPG